MLGSCSKGGHQFAVYEWGVGAAGSERGPK